MVFQLHSFHTWRRTQLEFCFKKLLASRHFLLSIPTSSVSTTVKFQILHFFTQKKQIFCFPTGPVPGFPNISCTVRCVEYFIWILVYVWHFLWLLVYWTVCLPLLHCPMDSHIIYLYCRYYSATIITMAGVRSTRTAIWLSALTSSVNFLFTMVGVYLVEKMGRRPLTLLSLLGELNHR